MPKKAIDETVLSGLEKQVDELVKNIDDVLKIGVDAGATGGGDNRESLPGFQRKPVKHTQQVDSPVANMVDDDADEDDAPRMRNPDVKTRIGKAAELLGIEPAELEVSMLALEKAKGGGKPPWLQGGSDDEEEDDEVDDSVPAKKAAPDDDTVVIEGQTISKAAVGDAVFNVMKAQSEKIAKQASDIKKAQDEAEMERLRKRADDKYGHVPGTTEERAKILKAVSALPTDLQKSFEKVMEQSEKLAKSAFDTLGSKGRGDSDEMKKTRRDFETKVAEIRKRESCSQTDALQKARIEDPEGFQAYQGN